jgi:hypothetical protein
VLIWVSWPTLIFCSAFCYGISALIPKNAMSFDLVEINCVYRLDGVHWVKCKVMLLMTSCTEDDRDVYYLPECTDAVAVECFHATEQQQSQARWSCHDFMIPLQFGGAKVFFLVIGRKT